MINKFEKRKVMPCSFCFLHFKAELLAKHELLCERNPNAPRPRYIHKGRVYTRKPNRPKDLTPAPLQVVDIFFPWDDHPRQITKDDAFFLLRKKVIERKISFKHFFVVETVTTEQVMEIEMYIKKARKMADI